MVADQRTADREALSLTARQLAHPRRRLLLEAQKVEDRIDAAAIIVEGTKKAQRLEHRQLVVELGFLQMDPESLAKRGIVRTPLAREDFDRPVVGLEQSFEDFDGRGLTCAVWTQQAEALPCAYLQVDSVDRQNRSVSLDETGTPERSRRLRGHVGALARLVQPSLGGPEHSPTRSLLKKRNHSQLLGAPLGIDVYDRGCADLVRGRNRKCLHRLEGSDNGAMA